MPSIKSVCVFCGHQPGADPHYLKSARELGGKLAEAGIELVFGAGNTGMMGALADAAVKAGGQVTGIIPEFLTKIEPPHPGITDLVLVNDMDRRKHIMFARSGAFIVLPGGFGTLDEAFEAVTLSQLSVHEKPIVFINIGGFFDPLRTMVTEIVVEGFASPEHGRFVQFARDVNEALEKLGISFPPPVG